MADYESLPDDGLRYEIVNGDLHTAPAPTTGQQTTSGLLCFHLMRHIQIPGRGRVFAAPIDVELAPHTVVQPDIVIVLHGSVAAITERRVVGPPDLVVAITSPSTASYNRREKRDAYAAAGVPEYWIVDPDSRTVELLALEGASYRSEHVYRGLAIVPSAIVPRWDVATGQLFAEST